MSELVLHCISKIPEEQQYDRTYLPSLRRSDAFSGVASSATWYPSLRLLDLVTSSPVHSGLSYASYDDGPLKIKSVIRVTKFMSPAYDFKCDEGLGASLLYQKNRVPLGSSANMGVASVDVTLLLQTLVPVSFNFLPSLIVHLSRH